MSGAAPLPKSLALNGVEASQRRLAAWRLKERPDREKKMLQRQMIFAIAVLLTFFAGMAQAQNLLTNPSLEFPGITGGGDDSVPPGWEKDESLPTTNFQSLAEPTFFGHRDYEADGGNGSGRFWNYWFQPYFGTQVMQPDNYAHLFQDVPGTPGMRYTMTGLAAFEMLYPGAVNNLNMDTGATPNGAPFDDGLPSPTDTFFALEFLDSAGAVLPGSVEVELKANGQLPGTMDTWFEGDWKQHTLVAIAPSGTVEVRVRASMIDGVYNPSLPSPQSFNMSAFVDAFSLTAEEVEGLPGDFDMDTDVDGHDFLLWQRGLSPSPLSATDLADWRSNFGAPLPPATAVPEPTALNLVGLVVGLSGWRRSRRLGIVRRA
jgi:hypothetical protein